MENPITIINKNELSLSEKEYSQKIAWAALSDNTRGVYESALASYVRSGFSLPATKMDVLHYLTTATKWQRKTQNGEVNFIATDKPLSISSLNTQLAALVFYNKLSGGENLKSDNDIANTLKVIKRKRGKMPKQAKPILLADLKRVINDKSMSLRNKALLSLGFVTASRRSELSALNINDLVFKEEGLEVIIQRSKTDQEGQGLIKYISEGNKKFCPIRIMKAYLVERQALSNAEDEQALFLSHSGKRLSGKDIGRIVTKYFGTTGHGLRSGFVSQAALAGIQVTRIAQQTGHKSLDMVNKYYQNVRGIIDSPTNDLY